MCDHHRRFFSSTASSQKLKIPTKHSRHLPPPACLSIEQLREMSDEIIESEPGSLIAYNSSPSDDAWHAWDLADATIQKVEWLIRGYSAQVENTQMHKLYAVDVCENPQTCVDQILKLVGKMEQEGKMYMDIRSKMQSQLAIEADREPDDVEINKEIGNAQNSHGNPMSAFASPGQTIGMFDTLLDTMSTVTDDNTPATVGKLIERIEERFQLDGGLPYNVNPNTVPTQMTWNAGLRAISNTENTCEKTRDDALTSSVAIFSALSDAHAIKNGATYAYMVQIVAKFIPPSEMSANVAHALWHMAKEDKVIDRNLMKAMESIDSGGYEKYDHFMNENIHGKNIGEIPLEWRMNEPSLRHSSQDDTY